MSKGSARIILVSGETMEINDVSYHIDGAALILSNGTKQILYPLANVLKVDFEGVTMERKKQPPKKKSYEYSKPFESFWQIYPKYPRVGKYKTYQYYQDEVTSSSNFADLMLATKSYSDHIVEYNRKARDPERFLKDGFWRDWIPEGESHGSDSKGMVSEDGDGHTGALGSHDMEQGATS
jgi:hypothetical protein